MKRKHPNFIDIAFILVLVAVAVVAYLLSHSEAQTVEAVPRSYMIQIPETSSEMADKIAVGDKVTDKIRGYDIGVVTAVEVLPSTTAVLDETQGKFVQAEIPGKITLNITVQADTVDSGMQISTVSGYVLQVGSPVSCAIDDYYAVGYIVSLER